MVTGTVELTPEVVKARLTALEQLVDDLDLLFHPLRQVRQRQDSSTWTSVGNCQRFARRYSQEVGKLDEALGGARARVKVLQKALSESARTTMERDEDVRERFLALDRRLADAPKSTGSPDTTTQASEGPYRPSADSTGGGGSW